MASHEQIKSNVQSMQSAWGTFRDLIHTWLPTYAKSIDRTRNAVNVRRNYR